VRRSRGFPPRLSRSPVCTPDASGPGAGARPGGRVDPVQFSRWPGPGYRVVTPPRALSGRPRSAAPTPRSRRTPGSSGGGPPHRWWIRRGVHRFRLDAYPTGSGERPGLDGGRAARTQRSTRSSMRWASVHPTGACSLCAALGAVIEASPARADPPGRLPGRDPPGVSPGLGAGHGTVARSAAGPTGRSRSSCSGSGRSGGVGVVGLVVGGGLGPGGGGLGIVLRAGFAWLVSRIRVRVFPGIRFRGVASGAHAPIVHSTAQGGDRG